MVFRLPLVLFGISRQFQDFFHVQALCQLLRKGIQMPAQFALLLRHGKAQMTALDVHGLTDRNRSKVSHVQLFNFRTQAFPTILFVLFKITPQI